MKTRDLALTALLVALTAVATILVRVPVPATGGYINLGDTMVFVSALLFGSRMGAAAGGVGFALADVLGGFPHWAPFTLLIKGAEGYVAGALARTRSPVVIYAGGAAGAGVGVYMTFAPMGALARIAGGVLALAAIAGVVLAVGSRTFDAGARVFSCILAGGVMVAGYFLAEVFLYGRAAAIEELPGNVAQVVGGFVVAVPVTTALRGAARRWAR